MSKRAFRNRFSEPLDDGLIFDKPSLTVQSAVEDVSIHSIAERGMNNLVQNTVKPVYGLDLSTLGDYQTALQIVADAKNAFEEMPVDLREKFHNNPEEFLAFVDNKEENYDEGVKLGIFSPKEKPTIFEKDPLPSVPSGPISTSEVTDKVSEKST